jgi:hypothetical protein
VFLASDPAGPGNLGVSLKDVHCGLDGSGIRGSLGNMCIHGRGPPRVLPRASSRRTKTRNAAAVAGSIAPRVSSHRTHCPALPFAPRRLVAGTTAGTTIPKDCVRTRFLVDRVVHRALLTSRTSEPRFQHSQSEVHARCARPPTAFHGSRVACPTHYVPAVDRDEQCAWLRTAPPGFWTLRARCWAVRERARIRGTRWRTDSGSRDSASTPSAAR